MNQWLSRIFARLRHFRSDSDLEVELLAHLEMHAEDSLAAGVPPAEARRRARLQVGQTAAVIERVHDQELITMLESWYRDFALGMRALRKNPVFCLTAILTLALGIGANTIVFTLLYGLLLRSLPVSHPEQLARIGLVSAASDDRYAFSGVPYHMLEQFRREQRSFSGISVWWDAEVTMSDNQGTLRAYGAGLVSGNAFPLMGMAP